MSCTEVDSMSESNYYTVDVITLSNVNKVPNFVYDIHFDDTCDNFVMYGM